MAAMKSLAANQSSGFWQAVAKRALVLFLWLVVQALAFFAAAGAFGWQAWLYFGLSAAMLCVNFVVFLKLAPEIIRERSEVKPGTKSWDKLISAGYAAAMMVLPFVAGLDAKLGWSSLGTEWVAVGVVLFAASDLFIDWAMVANKFFQLTARVESKQKTVSTGPYAIVRHPGYAAMIAMNAAAPLILGSAYALIPAAAIAVLLVARTSLEDEMLQKELSGYKQYVKKTRYRLVPGVW